MADLVKKIKIKKQDGTFTDYIPIGAEAQNISTSDGDSVQLKLNKKPYYYNSVADMKTDDKLKNGDMAITLGYYEPNDGGGAEYNITDTESESEYQEKLSSGLYATLIVEDVVNVKQLGAYGDNTHDDTDVLNSAIYHSDNVYIPEGSYKITDTITINGNKNIKCLGNIVSYVARIKPAILIKKRNNNIEFKDIVDQNSYENARYDEGWHGWEDSNYCAIELQDFSYSTLEFNKIANFTTGLKITGLTGDGTYKMKVTGYQIFNCRYGIYFKTLLNSWVNNNFIEKIMINYGSAGTFRTNCNPIHSYGVYQENVADDKYGIQYFEFNNLFFETPQKDNFTGFYFNLIKRTEFNKCIPEIKAGTVYALFDMKYPVEQDATPLNHSYQNVFNNCEPMGGNNTITYSNTGRALCSLLEIAKHNSDEYNLVYKENNLLGKMVKINNSKMSIKGYAFAPIYDTANNINTCQDVSSSVTNEYTQNCLNINAISPLALIIPCKLNDSFKIVLNENGAASDQLGNMQFKTFDENGALLEPKDENNNKKLSGYFSTNAYKNLMSLGGAANNIEFSVIDNNVKYILVYIYRYVNGFTVYKHGKPSIIKKFGDNLKHLYLLGDVAFSNAKPTSTADTDSVIKNQRVYNSNLANLGEYWEFDGVNWL